MWLKILKGIYVAAKAIGLDSKIKDWIIEKVKKSANRYDDKVIEAEKLIYKLYTEKE